MNISTKTIAAVLVFAGTLFGSGGGGGVPVLGAGPELRIFDVTAPPGGVALIRIGLTTPMPIISTSGSFAFDQGALTDVAGISLLGDYSTISGVAVRGPGQLKMQFYSSTGTFGTYADIPIMIIKIPVSPTAKIGNKYKLSFGSLQLTGPNGPYTATFKPGTFTVGGVSINESIPRTGTVNPGQQVIFKGTGFVGPVNLRAIGPKLANVSVVDSQTITFTAVDGFTMEGTEFDLINGDKNKSTDVFFSYRKGVLMTASQVPLINASDPVFSSTTFSSAVVTSPVSGLAIQNPSLVGAIVEIKLFDSSSNFLDKREYFIPPNGLLMESIQELVPSAARGS